MQVIKQFLLLVITAAAFLVAGLLLADRVFREPDSLWSVGPTIEHLEQMDELVTTKVYVSDVMVAENADFRGMWLIKGDALLGVEMGKAEIKSKNQDDRTAVIALPQPTIISPRVDHERTKTWSFEGKSWLPFTWKSTSRAESQFRDRAMSNAQGLIENTAAATEAADQARKTAELVVKNLYAMADWEVTVEWLAYEL